MAKTRARIADAFLDLILRRAYYRLRVSDITRKAKVGRATFYAHFTSKDALLTDRFKNIVRRLVVEVNDAPCFVNCTPLFAHVLGGRKIYRSLTAGPGRAHTERLLQDVLEARMIELMSTRAMRSQSVMSKPGFVPRFVAGTVLGLIAWGLEQEPAPTPEDLQAAYRSLVGQALAGAA
ncbi:MAG TPA: helix-turn-helix domain-containing protein [Steroidobacteraceae bacterium]